VCQLHIQASILQLTNNRTLKTIVSDLTKIQNQNRLLVVIFSNLNKDKVDGCVDRLAVALEKFNVIIADSIFDARLTFRVGWKRFAPSQSTRKRTRAVKKHC